MAGGRTPGPMCQVERPIEIDDGTMCLAATPPPSPVGNRTTVLASLPDGPAQQSVASAPAAQHGAGEFSEAPLSASAVPVGIGVASVARIPVPGTNGLFIELRPRGWIPSAGSTSTLFIQDVTGRRHLRLDYGFNRGTGRIDYHWNQSGTHGDFGIADHTTVGRGGESLYRSARYLRYGGRVLLVVGLALDVYSIVVARKRWRQVARILAGWGGAWAGCEAVGAGGAAAGTAIEPGGGTAVGGFLGCAVGGVGGYWGASWAAGYAYDWVEETFFEPLPEMATP